MADSAAELEILIHVLPGDLREALYKLGKERVHGELVEIILDLGRKPEVRLIQGSQPLLERPVCFEDLTHVESKLGRFTSDNRAGIERTLHRIAAIRNRTGKIVGLTLRVGRAIHGTIDILRDLLESQKNVLLLGRPGVGKTTKLREMARVLADDFRRRVIVVDTSNEIGGDGDIAHPAIGSARRMQVPRPELQHQVMVEAVENHMPEVILIDEIGTELEAAAARTIAERGVQLIATAHGTTLENLILNPTVSDLVGGTHTVTLGDEEARRRGTAKTITERRAPPTFDVVVEMVDRDEVVVYANTAQAVDRILEGSQPEIERRKRSSTGQIERTSEEREAVDPEDRAALKPVGRMASPARRPAEGGLRVFPFGLNTDLVRRAINEIGSDVRLVGRVQEADIVFAVRKRRADRWLREIENRGGPPLHFVKREKATLIRDALRRALYGAQAAEPEEIAEAVHEVEHAIERVLNERVPVALAPRERRIRRMQHEIIGRYHLLSQSVGEEPSRHLIVYPTRSNVEPQWLEEKWEEPPQAH